MLLAFWRDGTIAWHENDGSQNSTRIDIDTDGKLAYFIYAIDLDADGDIDVLSRPSFDSLDNIQFARDSVIVLYENDGSQNFTKTNIINDAALSVFAIDLDDDGDIDILSGYLDKVAWYENDGSQNFTKIDITTDEDGIVHISSAFAIDLDADGDLDVLSTSSGDFITWHKDDGKQNFTRIDIDINFTDVMATAFFTDLDGDNDIDILSTLYQKRSTNFNTIIVNLRDIKCLLEDINKNTNAIIWIFILILLLGLGLI